MTATTEPPMMIRATQTVVKEWVNPEWLKWKRTAAGVSQADLAARIDCHPSYLSNIECGLTVCSSRVAEAYCAL